MSPCLRNYSIINLSLLYPSQIDLFSLDVTVNVA